MSLAGLATVMDLKIAIWTELQIAPPEQRLRCGCKTLEALGMLTDQGIRPGSTVELDLRLDGGVLSEDGHASGSQPESE